MDGVVERCPLKGDEMTVDHEVRNDHYIRVGNAAIFGEERAGAFHELIINDELYIITYQDLLDLQEVINFAVTATQGKFP